MATTAVLPSTLCRRLDIVAQNYFNWAADGLLTTAGPSGCRLLDAVELAVLAGLAEKLGLRRVRPSWSRLREQLRSHVASGDVLVVYRQADDRLDLALSPSEAAELAIDSGPVRIVRITERIAAARSAFEGNPPVKRRPVKSRGFGTAGGTA